VRYTAPAVAYPALMHNFRMQRTVPWTPAQVYELVADVERYPEYLPGWREVSIIRTSEDQAEVAQQFGVGPFSMSCVSTAAFSPSDKIVIRSQAGPFSHLDLRWTFAPAGQGCRVTLVIDAEFRSRLMRVLSSQILESLAQRMLRAFERRASVVYGTSSLRS